MSVNPLVTEIAEAIRKPLSETPTSRDYARLYARYDMNIPVEVEKPSSQDRLLGTLETLAAYFSETAMLEEAVKNETPNPSDTPDKGLWVESVLTKLEEQGSKTCKLLKLGHQNVLGIGVYKLKTTPLLEDIMTKDNRAENGWRIRLDLAEDTVRIAHVRQEFIMDMSTGATADTMSWELAAMLSKDLETVTAASLRITEVDAKTDKGRLIRDSLAGGDLIVA